MEKDEIITIILLIAIGIALGVGISMRSPLGYSGAGGNTFSGGVTNASTTLANASSTTILVRNVNRQYASICNASSTGIFQIYFSAIVANDLGIAGHTVKSQECFEIDNSNLYLGRVIGYHNDGGSIIVTSLEK